MGKGICCLRGGTDEQLCAVPPCSEIIENLGISIYSLFEDDDWASSRLKNLKMWFDVQSLSAWP